MLFHLFIYSSPKARKLNFNLVTVAMLVMSLQDIGKILGAVGYFSFV